VAEHGEVLRADLTVTGRAAALTAIADAIAAVRRSHPVRVAIDGVDAAGKTTLAAELVPVLEARGRQVVRASADGFQRPSVERRRRGPESPEGYYLDAFDLDALRRELLDPLGPGGSRRYRTAAFDLAADEPLALPQLTAADDAVVLVDGVFLQRPELASCWELRVFVDVPLEEALRRGVARDGEESRRRYEQRYLPAQRRYLDEVEPRRRADVVLVNADPSAPRVERARGGG
jgi:uridine kinase